MATAKNNSTKKTVDVEKTNDESTIIQDLMAQIQALKEEINKNKKNDNSSSKPPAEKMIKFISLFKGSVMLKGSAKRPYEIEGQYNYRMFGENEARIICSQMGSYMREGFVYIDDADFVAENGLAEAYKSLLSPEEMKSLIKQNPSTIINAYKTASEGQQKIIIDMIIQRITKGENVDANIVRDLSKLSGVNLAEFSKDIDEE